MAEKLNDRKKGKMGFFDWLKKNEKEVKVFSDFISIFASFAVIFLLAITILQVSKAADNIKANTIYSIAKDGRELRKQINELIEKKKFNYGYVFNYIHSGWHQKRLCTLDDRMWAPIENEICQFLRDNPKANSYWNDDTKKLFDPEFVEYLKKLGERPECGGKKGGQS